MTDLARNPNPFRKRMRYVAAKVLLASLVVLLPVLTASSQEPSKPPDSVAPQASQPTIASRPSVQQTASLQPQFEVATVKPNRSSDPNNEKGYWKAVKGEEVKITMRNGNLLNFIEEAYGLKEYQIKGPDWLKSERFDIVATASHVSTKNQLGLMLQALLKERFKLEVHRESKVLPVYALVQGKNGAKIKPVKAEGDSGVWNGIGKLTAKKLSMANFAQTLSGQMDRPVLDMTGLEGVFDFTLEYTNPNVQPLSNGDAGAGPAPDLGSGPSLFTALQEQLGLKLESSKAPVEILVIDHAEKVPVEN